MEFIRLLQAARAGHEEALGSLLESCRRTLLATAERRLSPRLRVKLSAVDLVQETFLEACRDFRSFAGQSEAEWLGWLHRILASTLSDTRRCYCVRAKRDLTRETPLGQTVDAARLPSHIPTPAQIVVLQEDAAYLAQAIERLPRRYRKVIALGHYEHLKTEEIAQRLERTVPTVQKLRRRALQRLREEMMRARQGCNPVDSSS